MATGPSASARSIADEQHEPGQEPSLDLPRWCGPYLLLEPIGRGGVATLYLAVEEVGLETSRLAAIKMLRPEVAEQPLYQAMLLHEAQVGAVLRHRNIVGVHSAGRSEDGLYLALDYVEGMNLHQLLGRLSHMRVPFPAELPFLVVQEVLAALQVLHSACDAAGRPLALSHGDIAPDNILLSFQGEVLLCDMGAMLHPRGRLPFDGRPAAAPEVLVGKAAYLSPEQARGRPVDARSDLYSLGVLLWELCTGSRMRRGDVHAQWAMARAGEVPPLVDRGLPHHPQLAMLVTKALSPQPENRFQSALEMAAALAEYGQATQLHVSAHDLAAFMGRFGDLSVVQERRLRGWQAQTALAELESQRVLEEAEHGAAEPDQVLEADPHPEQQGAARAGQVPDVEPQSTQPHSAAGQIAAYPEDEVSEKEPLVLASNDLDHGPTTLERAVRLRKSRARRWGLLLLLIGALALGWWWYGPLWAGIG